MLLSRFGSTPCGTFGEWIADEFNKPTIEREWLPSPSHPAGTPNKSYIPDGVYALEPHHSEKWGDTYALVNESLGVYNYHHSNLSRWGILLHWAHLQEQLEGCIATGRKLGCLEGKWAVLSSKAAHRELMAYIESEDVETITIEWRKP